MKVHYSLTTLSTTILIRHQDQPQLDEDTETWPVPAEMIEDFERIKFNYQPVPLPIFNNDNEEFVELLEANHAIKNALVEIHFGIIHYKIGKAGQTHDSFTAVPKELIVLKPAPVGVASPYKRKNIRAGPVRPKKFEDFSKGQSSDSKGKGIMRG